MSKRTLPAVWCVLLALIALSLTSIFVTSASAEESPRARITKQIDERQTMRLAGNTRPEANSFNDRGPVSESMDLDHMLLVLQRSPEKEQELDKLIDSLNDKNSPNFHQWLTAEEIGERFGVAQEDLDKVTNWLQSHGFRVNQVYANRMMIDVSGTAGQVREAFGTEIHQLNINGEQHIANISDPRIPVALAPVVKGFASLNDFKPHAMYEVVPRDYTFSGCNGSTTRPTETGTCYAITPQDNQMIYNLFPLYGEGYSGQGQTIALVEDTDTYGTAGSSGASDWNTYRSTFGLATAFPSGSYTMAHPGGCTDPGTNGDDGEAAIDVEVATAIAPSAAIELISCPSTTFTFGGQIALLNLLNGSSPYPGIVSVSYGECEALNGAGNNATFYNTYQQAAAQGVSVFVSSGDAGPSQCSVDFNTPGYQVASIGITGWGETPYNVSVGGTDFEDIYNVKFAGASIGTYWNSTNSTYYGSAKQYVPEIPWNDSCGSTLISEYVVGSFTTYGSSPGFCNNSKGDSTSNYLIAGAGAGGASNCATGAGGINQGEYLISNAQCQGWPKPSYQSGSSLTGGLAVYGQPSDGVRDIPDVSMFASNGLWTHFETVCWSDPSQTSGGAVSCSGAPSTWAGFGGTSVASPTMAAIQALVNQKTGQMWGNPNPYYYQMAQNEYGTAGGTFAGTACNSSTGSNSGCVFNDVTQGDIDLACEDNGTTEEAHCYKPSGTRGVDSTDNVTAVTVINGGSGYTSAPTCTIAGPSNNSPYKTPTGTPLWAGGTQATCTAAVNSGTATAVWTIQIAVAAAGETITLSNNSGSVSNTYTLTGSTTTAECTALATSINSGTLATAACSSSTVTATAKSAGYAGNFTVSWGKSFQNGPDYVYITNTTVGQGPNYVSSITIGTAGTGYGPNTPITLTGAGSGAVATANTSPGTAAQSYQPTYGAAPGYDLATGLGTPNAISLVGACQWETPAQLSQTGIWSPSTATLSGTVATFCWNTNPSATAYWLDVGPVPYGNTYWQSGSLSTSTLSQTVNTLTGSGLVYATLWELIGGNWTYTEYSYSGGGGLATMTTPTPGSSFAGTSATFNWVIGTYPTTAYWIDVGSTANGHQYYQSGNLGAVFSKTVSGLPANGSTVYVTLYSLFNGSWRYNSYTYTAFGTAGGNIATLTSPSPNGSMLAGSSQTFTWTAGTDSISNYWIDVGSTAGGNQYYQSGALPTSTTSVTVNGLPTDGSEIYVTLYSLVSGTWLNNPYYFYAFSASSCVSTITSPAPGSELTAYDDTFSWTVSTNPGCSGAVTAYELDAGTDASENYYDQSGNIGNVLTWDEQNLPPGYSEPPATGPVQMTLWNLIGGTWVASPEVGYCAYGSSGYPGCTGPPTKGAPVRGTKVVGKK